MENLNIIVNEIMVDVQGTHCMKMMQSNRATTCRMKTCSPWFGKDEAGKGQDEG